jgi:hypothetical protein
VGIDGGKFLRLSFALLSGLLLPALP